MTTDISLVEELKLVQKSADPRAPFFTGWRSCDINAMVTGRDPDEAHGYVGQVIQWLGEDQVAYVNLPGKEFGLAKPGGLLEIGKDRIYTAPSSEDMREMLVSGLNKLKEIVEEHKKGEPCPTAQTS